VVEFVHWRKVYRAKRWWFLLPENPRSKPTTVVVFFHDLEFHGDIILVRLYEVPLPYMFFCSYRNLGRPGYLPLVKVSKPRSLSIHIDVHPNEEMQLTNVDKIPPVLSPNH
jgi:hypothetical protein